MDNIDQLKQELRLLILEESENEDLDPSIIEDSAPLVRGGAFELDSLDVLQICMEIKSKYGVRIEGSGNARKILQSLNTLAEHVAENRTK